MKKLTKILLSICALVFAVSCSSGLDADASQSGGNPADLIPPDGGSSSLTAVTAFINEYAGVYYSEGEHAYNEGMINNIVKANGLKVDYKFRDGKIYTLNYINQATDLIVEPVEAVMASAKKLQLRRKDKGEVLVLNMTDEGLESYVSYILEKVSDDVLIENSSAGVFDESFIPYKGTYSSLAEDNKIENYIAIDENGYIYFYDANVTLESGRVGYTEGEGLTIIEAYQNSMRKIIFKFDQGVYRRYSIDGARANVDETYIGICKASKDFIEDRFANAIYQSDDYKVNRSWGEGQNWAPLDVSGVWIKLNEPTSFNASDGLSHHVTLEGAVCVQGEIGDRWTQERDDAKADQVGHVSVLIGNELHVMGRYNAVFTFSDDWKTATYNGKAIKLVSGEVKNVVPSARKTSSFIPLKRR